MSGTGPSRKRDLPPPGQAGGVSELVVVEIAGRGKLVVGEPYFSPGVPLVLDRKGLGGAGRGDLAVVRKGRGRARLQEVLGPAGRIESVLEGLFVEEGLRTPFEPYDPPASDPEGRVDLRELLTFTIDPERAEDLRRRALVPPRGRRPARLGPHRRRLALRPGRQPSRPRRGRPGVVRLRSRPRGADAPARACRRPLQPQAASGSAHDHGRGARSTETSRPASPRSTVR